MNLKVIFLFGLFMSTIPLYAQEAMLNHNISEVYGEENFQVIIEDEARYNFFKKLLDFRIEYVEENYSMDEKFPKLSSVPILNKYNPSLSRDAFFDPSTFNPLKYDMNFSSQTTQVYRIDNTPFLIVIKPQN